MVNGGEACHIVKCCRYAGAGGVSIATRTRAPMLRGAMFVIALPVTALVGMVWTQLEFSIDPF